MLTIHILENRATKMFAHELWVLYHYHYYDLYLQSLEEIVMNDDLLYLNRTDMPEIHTWWYLLQLQRLGFNYDHRNDMDKIKDYIDLIVPK